MTVLGKKPSTGGLPIPGCPDEPMDRMTIVGTPRSAQKP